MLGALEPKINIEGISIYPIVIGNNIENYEKVLAHELQHFINKFLINIWWTLEKVIGETLKDEIIAQTIYGKTSAEELKNSIIKDIELAILGEWRIGYAYGQLFEDYKTSTDVNQVLLDYVKSDKIEIAYAFKDKEIENYAYILAAVPFSEWDKLKKIYLS